MASAKVSNGTAPCIRFSKSMEPSERDKKRRGGVNVQPVSLFDVRCYSARGFRGHTSFETRLIEANSFCTLREVSYREGLRVREKPFVHLPESPLASCALGGFARLSRLGMDGLEWKRERNVSDLVLID